MNVTYFGHSAFLVETTGQHLLFDPFISPNPKASHIDLNSIKADYILLSHGHADHVADVHAIHKQTNATLISNFEVIEWFANKGIKNGVPLNLGGSCEFPFGRLEYVTAAHSSSMPDGSYGGNPGGFVISNTDGCFYFSGDTALTMDTKLLAERHKPDWAALCIGDHFTMGYQDAATAAKWLGIKNALGVHYDTFPPIEIDHDKARTAFAKAGCTLHLPKPGDTIHL